MNGASGKYEGAMVNVAGTSCARVVNVAGTTVVVSTMPGRMLPTGEPMPGKKPAAPKLLPPPEAGPRVAVKGGPPVRSKPKPAAVPPVNGNCTKNGPPGSREMTVPKPRACAANGVITTMPPLRNWFGLKVTTPVGLICGIDRNNCEFGR